MKRLLLLLFSAAALLAAQAKTVVVTITDAQNPTGTTYTVYKAPGLCTSFPTYAKIASALTVLTYTDTTVTVANYCYYGTATVNGVESVPSNFVQVQIQPYAPIITAIPK